MRTPEASAVMIRAQPLRMSALVPGQVHVRHSGMDHRAVARKSVSTAAGCGQAMARHTAVPAESPLALHRRYRKLSTLY